MYELYKTTNTTSGKYYIGVHKISNKPYLGSGKKLLEDIKLLGKQNFIKETIILTHSKEQVYEWEKIIVNKEFLKNENVYNLMVGGHGGELGGESILLVKNSLKKHFSNPEVRKKISEKRKEWHKHNENSFKGKKHSEEARKKLSENAKKRTGDKNPFYGKKLTEEHKEKLRKTTKEKQTGVPKPGLQKYRYFTPFGVFRSSRHASEVTGIGRSRIMKRCFNPKYKDEGWYIEHLDKE